MVIDGFETHQYDVALGHINRGVVNMKSIQVKRAVTRVNLQAVLLHIIIITTQQEVYFLPVLSQTCAIISANGSSTYYSVFHFANQILACKITKIKIKLVPLHPKFEKDED